MTISNKSGSFGLLSLTTLFLLTFFIYSDSGAPYTIGFLFLSACAVVCVSLKERWLMIDKTRLLYWMLTIVVIVFTLAPNARKERLTVYYALAMLEFGLFLLFMKPSDAEIKRVLKWLEIGAVIIALYVLFVQFYPSFYWNHIYPHLSSQSQEYAMQSMSNGYGVTIGASVIFADYRITMAILIRLSKILFSSPEKRRVSFKDVLLLALYFAAILIENRRGEVLSLFGAVLCLYLFSMNPRKRADFLKKFIWFVAIVVISVAALLILYQCGALGRYQSMMTRVIEGESSGDITSGRFDLWRIALDLFLRNPVFGIGWQQFPNYNGSQLHVHNTYLQWLCEVGVTGFILLIIPTIALFFMSFRQFTTLVKQSNPHRLSAAMGTAGFGMQLYFLLLNFIDPAFHQHMDYFGFFALAIMMTEWSSQYQAKTEKRIADLIPSYIIISEGLL